MTQFVSIETDKNLGRDLSTNGVISTNQCEYEKYLLQKRQKEEEKGMIHSMQEEIHSLKNDLLEIKRLILGMACDGK